MRRDYITEKNQELKIRASGKGKEMKVNTDLHLHSKYSMASSRKMELPTIAREASKKGMELIRDCRLHSSEVARRNQKSSPFQMKKSASKIFILSLLPR